MPLPLKKPCLVLVPMARVRKPLVDCAGHYGCIKLELPVFHIGYFKHTLTALQVNKPPPHARRNAVPSESKPGATPRARAGPGEDDGLRRRHLVLVRKGAGFLDR